MFRSIGSRVIKKSESLRVATNQQTKLDEDVKEFLLSVFGDKAKAILIEAKLDKQNLFIRTNNKIVANEIVFQSSALHKFLKEKGVTYQKMIIQ